jgi:hypothetical protein
LNVRQAANGKTGQQFRKNPAEAVELGENGGLIRLSVVAFRNFPNIGFILGICRSEDPANSCIDILLKSL